MPKVPTVEGPPLAERMLQTVTQMDNVTSPMAMATLFEQAKYLLRASIPVVQKEQAEAYKALDEVQGALAVVRAMISGAPVCCKYCGEEV